MPDATRGTAGQLKPTRSQGNEPKEVDRRKILDGLYRQLSCAKDAKSSEFIATAIQNIWLKSDSDTVDILMSRASRLIQGGEFYIALNILDTVVVIAPDFTEGWNQRATAHFLKRDYRASLRDLRHVLALDPRHFRAVNGLGLILQELGDKKAALKAYRKALQLNPFLIEARRVVRDLGREVEGQGI